MMMTLLLIVTCWLCGCKCLIIQMMSFDEDIIRWWKLYNIMLWFAHCRVCTWKSHAFIVILSLWWRTKFVWVYVSWWRTKSVWVYVSWWRTNSVRDYVSGLIGNNYLPIQKYWYHMLVEVPRSLHALEIGETCHISLCDLVIICIGETWWMLLLYGILDLYMLFDMLW